MCEHSNPLHTLHTRVLGQTLTINPQPTNPPTHQPANPVRCFKKVVIRGESKDTMVEATFTVPTEDIGEGKTEAGETAGTAGTSGTAETAGTAGTAGGAGDVGDVGEAGGEEGDSSFRKERRGSRFKEPSTEEERKLDTAIAVFEAGYAQHAGGWEPVTNRLNAQPCSNNRGGGAAVTMSGTVACASIDSTLHMTVSTNPSGS